MKLSLQRLPVKTEWLQIVNELIDAVVDESADDGKTIPAARHICDQSDTPESGKGRGRRQSQKKKKKKKPAHRRESHRKKRKTMQS